MDIFAGLSHGCASTEADVWLYNGTLYVRAVLSCGYRFPDDAHSYGNGRSVTSSLL